MHQDLRGAHKLLAVMSIQTFMEGLAVSRIFLKCSIMYINRFCLAAKLWIHNTTQQWYYKIKCDWTMLIQCRFQACHTLTKSYNHKRCIDSYSNGCMNPIITANDILCGSLAVWTNDSQLDGFYSHLVHYKSKLKSNSRMNKIN